jgi:hypothetical protein
MGMFLVNSQEEEEGEREREKIRKNICNRPLSLFHIEHPAAAHAK